MKTYDAGAADDEVVEGVGDGLYEAYAAALADALGREAG